MNVTNDDGDALFLFFPDVSSMETKLILLRFFIILFLTQTPRFYSPSDPSDIKQTVNHIFTRYPNAPIFGLGHSMGACMLVKYLEAVGKDTPMVSCTSLSNPWEWQIVSKNMEYGSFLNRKIINPHFAKFWQT